MFKYIVTSLVYIDTNVSKNKLKIKKTFLLRNMKPEHPTGVPAIETLKNSKTSEYDQEIPQSQTADKPTAPRGRGTQQSRETRKTYQAKQPVLSSPSR